MHRCLELEEILALICAEISEGDILTIETHAALVGFAQTCRKVEDPALNELWRRQTSLGPLVRCFPQDMWGYDPKGILIFHRGPQKRDWEKLIPYASRIKELMYRPRADNPFPSYASIRTWQVLAISQPPTMKNLLPNLQRLTWNEHELCSSFIRLLLSPTLAHLELLTTGNDLLRLSLLPYLHELCPALRSIIFRGGSSPSTTESISAAICQWNHLRVFDAHDLTPEAFAHLASMPTLATLRYRGKGECVEKLASECNFPALRDLTLIGLDISHVVSILKSISNPQLKRLDITASSLTSALTWKELFVCLGDSRSTLSDLVLNDPPSTTSNLSDVNEFSVGQDVLRPLLELPNLTHVEINPGLGASLDNKLLQQLAEAWPRLRKLELGLPPSPYYTQPFNTILVTFAGLIALVVRRPELVHLGILINALAVDAPNPIHHGSRAYNTKIRSLKVGCSPIAENFVDVATLLSDIFPNLTSIGTTDRRRCGHTQIWANVSTILQRFTLRRPTLNVQP